MRGRCRRIALVAASSLLLAAPARAQELQITYLGNMGVLVERGGVRILVDALFRDSMDPYQRHAPDVQEPLETGAKPYDGVALALATHFHLDHWDAGAVTRFLRTHPAALFGSTEQGVAMMPYDVRDRARNLWPAAGVPSSTLEIPGATVTALPLVHGKTQNLGYRIAIGDRSLAHFGDADPSQENFSRLATVGRVDVALVPFWWLGEPKAVSFLKTWRPRNLVALHVGTTDLESLPRAEAAWPGVWTAVNPLAARRY